jgi:mannonate dehydratase
MKLGMGLYRNMFTANELRFAKQAGATHIVAHMPAPASATGEKVMARYGKQAGHGYGAGGDYIWSYEGLRDLKALVNSEDLQLEALENFAPGDWYDILLDGPRKAEQYEHLKQIIRDMGRVGIPVMGYYFSLAGVWGHQYQPKARGSAVSAGYVQAETPEPPIPAGMVWNMVYDAQTFNPADTEHVLPAVSDDEIQRRFTEFLEIMVPVAEEAGVKLALHPDDPPMPVLRGQHRLSYTMDRYKHILEINPSPNNTLEMCVGTMAEMAEGDIYETVDAVSRMGRVGYIHFRNVRGKVPNYFETFVDEGDTDMIRLLTILHHNGYDGVLIPDHTPQMQCAAPWHAGMAFAMGYIKAALTMIERQA